MFRILTGIVVTAIGLGLLIAGLTADGSTAIFGIGVSVIGIAILLNKKEDEIEQIKSNITKNHD